MTFSYSVNVVPHFEVILIFCVNTCPFFVSPSPFPTPFCPTTLFALDSFLLQLPYQVALITRCMPIIWQPVLYPSRTAHPSNHHPLLTHLNTYDMCKMEIQLVLFPSFFYTFFIPLKCCLSLSLFYKPIHVTPRSHVICNMRHILSGVMCFRTRIFNRCASCFDITIIYNGLNGLAELKGIADDRERWRSSVQQWVHPRPQ